MTDAEQLKHDIENHVPVGRFTCGDCGGKHPAYFVAVRIESISEGMLSGGPCPFCGGGACSTITYDTNHGGTGDPQLSAIFEPAGQKNGGNAGEAKEPDAVNPKPANGVLE